MSEPDIDLAPITGTSRRVLLRGAVLAGVSVPFLAACGSDEDAGGGDEGGGDTGGGQAPAGPIASVADVPEGSGVILEDPKVVITQPTAGEFKAFSSICTHQQCPLDNIANGTINCVCHGSKFSIEDGSVANGPATEPLPEMQIEVDGQDILMSGA